MKLAEIAEKIQGHLKRFENDPKINRETKWKTLPFWYSNCWASGSKVGIRYISYQGESFMSKAEAVAYLAWLDAGNVGQHWRIRP